jgi:hypothetical protein
MFNRPHHQRIAKVLESLDADLLKQHNCLFVGAQQLPCDRVSTVNRLI